jgi:hypothetical protein
VAFQGTDHPLRPDFQLVEGFVVDPEPCLRSGFQMTMVVPVLPNKINRKYVLYAMANTPQRGYAKRGPKRKLA